MHAYLGQIDERPLENPIGGQTSREQYEFRTQRVSDVKGTLTVRVEGESDLDCAAQSMGGMRHSVKLRWDGFLVMQGDRLTRLVLSAKGTERLRWSLPPSPEFAEDRPLVTRLMAGRAVRFDGKVRYGILSASPPAIPPVAALNPKRN